MARHEQGVYEPPSEDLRIFDGGEDDYDEEGSHLPLLIVTALLIVAAFGFVVWFAYNQGVQHGRESTPRLIAAEEGPVRTAPANPGGATPYKGLKVYEQPAPEDESSNPAQSTPAPAPAEKAKAAETQPSPALALRRAEPGKAKAELAKPVAKQEPAKPVAKQEPAKPVAVKTQAAKPVKAAAAGGAYVLQIGAYKSEADAKAAWAAYQHRHPSTSGMASDVQKADLGAKGTWYRLRIGSFADRAAAGAFCDKLKADHGGCFPARF